MCCVLDGKIHIFVNVSVLSVWESSVVRGPRVKNGCLKGASPLFGAAAQRGPWPPHS